MSEYAIGYVTCLNLVGLALACLFYMLGGRNNKGIRRFGASAIITATVCGSSVFLGVFSWWLLLLYPVKVGEYIQGYSADRGMPAGLKRFLIALTSVVGGVLCCVVFQAGWWMLFLHTYISMITITFAFKNPLHAAAEEPLVCALNSLVLVFYPLVVGIGG